MFVITFLCILQRYTLLYITKEM